MKRRYVDSHARSVEAFRAEKRPAAGVEPGVRGLRRSRFRAGALSAGLIASIVLCGCANESLFELSEGSAVVVLRSESRLEVYGVESRSLEMELRRSEDAELFVLRYPLPLAEYGFAEGPLTIAEPDEPGVVLAPPTKIEFRALKAGRSEPLELLLELPRELAELRVRVRSVGDCVAGGGCYLPRPGDSVLTCRETCPEASVPAPPVEPSPPSVTPCPEGWHVVPAVDADGVDVCAPWGGIIICPDGTVRLPGDDLNCTRIGSACLPREFGVPPEGADAVYYVNERASGPGNGTESDPWPNISSLPRAVTGTVALMLAEGTYSIPISVAGRLIVVGACARQTEVVETVWRRSGDLSLRNVTLKGFTCLAGRTEMKGVIAEVLPVPNSDGFALKIGGECRLDAEEVLVRGNRRLEVPGEKRTWLGFSAEGRATARLKRIRFEGVGIRVSSGAELLLEDAVVQGTQNAGPLPAILASDGGQLQLQLSVVYGNANHCLVVDGANTEVQAAQFYCSTVEDSTSAGIRVENGARLVGSRIVIDGARSSSGFMINGAVADLEDVVVDSFSSMDENHVALGAVQAAEVQIRRALIRWSSGSGVLSEDDDTILGLRDTRIVEPGRRGIVVRNRAKLRVEQVQVHRAHWIGVLVDDGGALDGLDLAIDDTRPRVSDDAAGRGLNVWGASRATLRRVRVGQARQIGVLVGEVGSQADLADLLVTGTRPSGCASNTCIFGISEGFSVVLGADAEVRRFHLDDNQGSGLRVAESGSQILLSDGLISNNGVGLQLFVDTAYDPRPLLRGVRIAGNVRDLQGLDE